MDDGDVAKFTDAIKEFDGMTRLVCCSVLWFLVLPIGVSFIWQRHAASLFSVTM